MENKLICGLCGSLPTLVWVHKCCSYNVSHECVFKRHIPAQVKKQTPTLNMSKCVISTDCEFGHVLLSISVGCCEGQCKVFIIKAHFIQLCPLTTVTDDHICSFSMSSHPSMFFTCWEFD